MFRLRHIAFALLLVGCQTSDGSFFNEPDAGSAADVVAPALVTEGRIGVSDSEPRYAEEVRFETRYFDRDGDEVFVDPGEISWRVVDGPLRQLQGGVFVADGVGEATVESSARNVVARYTIDVLPQRIGNIYARLIDPMLAVGSSARLEYDLRGLGDTPYQTPQAVRPEFRSTAPEVFTVDAEGVVQALSPGVGEVEVAAQGVTDRVAVEVFEHELVDLLISIPGELLPGTGRYLHVEVLWEPWPPADFSVVFSSSDPDVVSIDDEGLWLAVSDGSATITASVPGQELTASADVVVGNDVVDFATSDREVIAIVSGTLYSFFGFFGADRQASWGNIYSAGRVFDLVDGGERHFCAREGQTESVWCRGSSSLGQAGEFDNFVNIPIEVQGAGPADALIVSGERSCVRQAGTTSCWGRLESGNTVTPTAVSYSDFASSPTHLCTLSGTTIACSGENFDGQLGLGTTGPADVGVVASTESFEQVVVGQAFTCARTTTGEAWCWGDGDEGQLGTGLFADASVPQRVTGAHTFVEIAAGLYHVCALDDAGKVWCWGRGENGQVGDGTTNFRAAPTAIDSGLEFLSIDSGGRFTCALESLERDVWCWGGSPIERLRPARLEVLGQQQTGPFF